MHYNAHSKLSPDVEEVRSGSQEDPEKSETYCMPHHLTVDGGKRSLMIAALRYYDTFVKQDGAWLFAERLLYVDWIEERILS